MRFHHLMIPISVLLLVGCQTDEADDDAAGDDDVTEDDDSLGDDDASADDDIAGDDDSVGDDDSALVGDLHWAEAIFLGGEEAWEAGRSVAGAGDVDGDGNADLLFGSPADGEDVAPGRAFLHNGPVSGQYSLSQADAIMVGEDYQDAAGYSVATAGDVDTDGHDDILVGARGRIEGTAYLLHGPLGGTIELALADAKFTASGLDVHISAVSAAGDMNGDSLGDVLIGGERVSESTQPGGAFLFHGPFAGTRSLEDADVTLAEENIGDRAGTEIGLVGDVDADGQSDLMVGAVGHPAGDMTGKAYLLQGPVIADQSLADADTSFAGVNVYDHAGASFSSAGDANGDGYGDILIGAYFAGEQERSGTVYMFHGPLFGEYSLAEANAAISGASQWAYFGFEMATDFDADGDGFDDLLVGAPSHGGLSRLYLFLGPLMETTEVNQADAVLVEAFPGEAVGLAMAMVGDATGDDVDDLLIGAPWNGEAGQGAGKVYLLSGADIL